MSEISKNFLELHIASGDVVDVRRFDVTEKMSALFQIKVVALSPNPDVDFEAVVGQPASFTLHRESLSEPSRTWTGVCTTIRQLEVEPTGLSTYEITIAPVAWFMSQRRNYRVFQRTTELDIARTLLSEWHITPVEHIGATYKKRKYRVQYGESDFAFICRMLEGAGISLYFRTEDGETKLVLDDHPHDNTPRPPLHFFDKPNATFPEHVTDVQVGRRVRPGKYTVRDLDYRKVNFTLEGTDSDGLPNEQQLESYHYRPGSFLYESSKANGNTPVADDKGKYRAEGPDGTALAKRSLEAKRVSKRIVELKTGVVDIAPGVVFTMLDHPKSELSPDKKLLVTSSRLAGEHLKEWMHTAEAVSADIPYRPARVTPKPEVRGVESATVVGPANEEIHVDEMGRVRVQFHWDRLGKKNDESSCWIPVSHPWAGSAYGMINIPRVGHEVIVDFLSGDPDRPIVVGRVYTSTTVPYPLPAHKTQSGWKSSSSPGGAGFNELMFEDLAGSELVRIQAQKDLRKLVKHDETVTIVHDRTKKVGNDDSLTVGNDRTRMVGNNESVTVGANQTVTVGKNQTITVGVDQSLTVHANQTITLPSGNQTETITGNRTFTLTGDLSETQTGNWTKTQSGNRTETHKGNSDKTHVGNSDLTQLGKDDVIQLGDRVDVQAGSATYLHLGSETHLQLGSRLDVQLGGRTEVQIGAYASTEIGTRTETIVGSRTLGVSATNTETVGGAQQTTTGDNTETVNGVKTLTATGALKASGATVTVTSDGVVTIKGSIIKLNC